MPKSVLLLIYDVFDAKLSTDADQESKVADAADSGGLKRHQRRLALLLVVIVLVALLY